MSQPSPYTISPLGDSALLLSFGNTINREINNKILSSFNFIKESAVEGILEIVPAYCSLAIYFNPLIRIPPASQTAFEYYSKQVSLILDSGEESFIKISREIQVPVCYAEKYGPDMNILAAKKLITVDEVIRIHCSKKYRVYMIGFLPGFAYMGEVDERIAMPRHAQPRLSIQPGSVGIADRQTGIYPVSSPGGWQIIGRTPITIFNKESEDIFCLFTGIEILP